MLESIKVLDKVKGMIDLKTFFTVSLWENEVSLHGHNSILNISKVLESFKNIAELEYSEEDKWFSLETEIDGIEVKIILS